MEFFVIDIETFFFQLLIYNVEDILKIRKRIFLSRFRTDERRKRRTRFINFFTIDIDRDFFFSTTDL